MIDHTLHFRRLWLLIGVALVLLTIAGSLTPKMPDINMSVSDKFLHLFVYAVLGSWFAALTARRWRLLISLMALGGTLEILQAIGGSRYAEGMDMLANALGAGIGVFIVGIFTKPCLAYVDRQMAALVAKKPGGAT